MYGSWVALILVIAGGGNAQEGQPTHHWPTELVWIAVGPVSVGANQEVGSLMAVGPVTVEGKVHGDVTSLGGKVTVAPSGVIAGQLTALCAQADVAEGGKVAGDVKAYELPEMDRTSLSLRSPADAELIVGNAEFSEPFPTCAVVIGGDAIVRAGSGLTEILAVGGNVRIEAGAHVKAARVVGGKLERVATEEGAQDQVTEPFILRCAGHSAPGGVAAALWTSNLEEDVENVKLAAYSEEWGTGEVHLAAFGVQSRVELTIAAKYATRSPLPKGRSLGEWRQNIGEGWDSWPKRQLWVATDADPLLIESAALGVGVRIDAGIESPGEPHRRSSQRSITLGVPSDARELIAEPERPR